jgi:hypothetical protein
VKIKDDPNLLPNINFFQRIITLIPIPMPIVATTSEQILPLNLVQQPPPQSTSQTLPLAYH